MKELEVLVQELLSRLNQNSSNSHQPPSSDPPSAGKVAGKKPTGRTPGGQPGHKGHCRKRLPPERVDQVIHYRPSECKHCQASLSPEQASEQVQWHQVFDLPEIAAIVTEHQAHGCRCGRCGKISRAEIPAAVLSHGIGPRLAAVMSYLSGRCHDGRRVVEEIVEDLFGVPVSLGTVSNYEGQMSDALEQASEQAQAKVRQAAVKNVDETSWRQAGKMRWLWAAATRTVVAFGIFAGRNKDAFFGLLGRNVKGIVCSDRWNTYNHVPKHRRQVCWAHLKRDFQKWQDKGDATRKLGTDGLEVCRGLFELWRRFENQKLARAELIQQIEPLKTRMGQILRWGLRCGDPKAVKFCRNIMSLESALWTFAGADGVEPTNNHAERVLRMGVIWRKNAFGSHSEGGCRFVERILTTVQTLRLQQRPVLNFFHETLIAHRNHSTPPKLA